jgi:hypothetical protein
VNRAAAHAQAAARHAAAAAPAFRIAPADAAAERVVDAIADRVLRRRVLQRRCRQCEEERLPHHGNGSGVSPEAATAVAAALAGPTRRLDGGSANLLAARIGIDPARMRVHDGTEADHAARSVGARAFALGEDLVFARGEYRPETPGGRQLLAHELAHVAQDRSGATLRRFTRREEGDISTLDEVIDLARAHAGATGAMGLMRWGRFVAANGGQAAGEVIAGALGGTGSTARTNRHRYLFTCLCGLIDMRHFYQVMYAGLLEGNRAAVERGREHELHAEETSRFAPEDSPSNALGALFGSGQSWVQRQSVFVANLRAFLQRCHPIDYDALPEAERRQILDWYAVSGTGRPANPNEQAFPNMERIGSCAGLGMFPFVIAGQPGRFNRLEGPIEE